MYRISAIILGLVFLAGCSTPSQEAKEAEAKPVNCETAQEDIATLEKERASVTDRMAAGARTFLPSAAVVDVIYGYNQEKESADDYFDGRNEVTSGRYNEKIDAKIAEIKEICNL